MLILDVFWSRNKQPPFHHFSVRYRTKTSASGMKLALHLLPLLKSCCSPWSHPASLGVSQLILVHKKIILLFLNLLLPLIPPLLLVLQFYFFTLKAETVFCIVKKEQKAPKHALTIVCEFETVKFIPVSTPLSFLFLSSRALKENMSIFSDTLDQGWRKNSSRKEDLMRKISSTVVHIMLRGECFTDNTYL
jgi:hypothetical protein